jgi:pimeloyl-ACP methyl ester carboxylesterase
MELQLDGHPVFIATGHQDLDPGKPTIVFIHGAGMDHTVWTLLSRYFARRGHNVIALDLPAHGRSGGEPLQSVPAMARWVDAVLDALHIERAAVVGHSMGSLVAFEMAASYPDRTAQAVLLGFALPMAVGPPLLDAARNNDPSAIDMMVIFGHDFRSQLGGNRVSGVHVVNSAKRLLERNRPGVLFNDLNACNEYANESAAQTIQCPVVFGSGERDKMTSPRVAAAMAQALAHARMEIIENSGHGVMAEQPELTHRLLVTALGGG